MSATEEQIKKGRKRAEQKWIGKWAETDRELSSRMSRKEQNQI